MSTATKSRTPLLPAATVAPMTPPGGRPRGGGLGEGGRGAERDGPGAAFAAPLPPAAPGPPGGGGSALASEADPLGEGEAAPARGDLGGGGMGGAPVPLFAPPPQLDL